VSPFPNLHVLQPNIRFFVRNGARQHFQQSNTGAGHEFSELKQYLLARLLWNPDADGDAVVKEFLDATTAQPTMDREVHRRAPGRVGKSGARLDIYEPPATHADGYLSADRVAQYNECSTGGDISPRRCCRAGACEDRAAAASVRDAGDRQERPVRAEGVPSAGRRAVRPRPEMTRLLEDFFQVCARNGVRTLNESGLTPRQYYDAARRFVDVQVEGNKAFRIPVMADPLRRRNTRVQSGAPDRRRSRRERLQVHWLGGKGRTSISSSIWVRRAGKRSVDQHALGRAQLDRCIRAA